MLFLPDRETAAGGVGINNPIPVMTNRIIDRTDIKKYSKYVCSVRWGTTKMGA